MGIVLLNFMFFLFGGVLVATGLGLVGGGILSKRVGNRYGRHLESRLCELAVAKVLQIPSMAVRHYVSWFDHAVLRHMIFDVERSTFAGPVVTIVVGLAVPVAATLNMLLGGSPMLFYGYAAALILIVFLAVTDALGRFRTLKQVSALLIVVLWCGVLPLYATWSLTNHFMGGPVHRGVVSGLIIGSFLYASISAIWTVIRAQGRSTAGLFGYDFMGRFIVGVTLFYVGYWLMLLCASVVGDFDMDRSWWTLIAAVVGGALSFAAMLASLKRCQGHGSVSVVLGILVSGGMAVGISYAVFMTAPAAQTTIWVASMPVFFWVTVPLFLLFSLLFKVLMSGTGAWGQRHAIVMGGVAALLPGGALCLLAPLV